MIDAKKTKQEERERADGRGRERDSGGERERRDIVCERENVCIYVYDIRIHAK